MDITSILTHLAALVVGALIGVCALIALASGGDPSVPGDGLERHRRDRAQAADRGRDG